MSWDAGALLHGKRHARTCQHESSIGFPPLAHIGFPTLPTQNSRLTGICRGDVYRQDRNIVARVHEHPFATVVAIPTSLIRLQWLTIQLVQESNRNAVLHNRFFRCKDPGLAVDQTVMNAHLVVELISMSGIGERMASGEFAVVDLDDENLHDRTSERRRARI